MGRKVAVLVLVMSLMAAMGVFGCSKKDSPTAPVDPNAGTYGTWNGTLTETSPGPSVQQFGIKITLTCSPTLVQS